MKNSLVMALILLGCATPVLAADFQEGAVKEFLATRQVLGSIAFPKNSAMLEDEGRALLDSLVPRLREARPVHDLIRIEGFSGSAGSGGQRLSLALERAGAVQEYLRSRHDLDVQPFLTGFGAGSGLASLPPASSRVDIAVYDNLWGFVDAPRQAMNGGMEMRR